MAMVALSLASTRLPTQHGEIRICAFRVGDDPTEHVALVKGELAGAEGVPTYVHSACVLGDVLGALHCDCRLRLNHALERLGTSERGAVVYLQSHPDALPIAHELRSFGGQGDLEGQLPERGPSEARAVALSILRTLGARSIEMVDGDER